MLRLTQILIWRLAAVIALAVGVAGLAAPVLPTTPFLIVSAWAAGKGWPALERWLLAHRTFGPHIRNWRVRGAIPLKAKLLATLMMVGSGVLLQFSAAALWLKIAAPATMFMVAVWLWTRPDA